MLETLDKISKNEDVVLVLTSERGKLEEGKFKVYSMFTWKPTSIILLCAVLKLLNDYFELERSNIDGQNSGT